MKLSIPEIKYSEYCGYDVQLKSFGHLHKMTKGDRHLWIYKVDPKKWIFAYMTADYLNNAYVNKQSFDTLNEALDRPL